MIIFLRTLLSIPFVLVTAWASTAFAGEQRRLPLVGDTFIHRGVSTDYGSSSTFLVKREHAATSGGGDRIAYLRFAADPTVTAVEAASFVFTITQYAGDTNGPYTFEVFGLPDGHPDEAFDPSLLRFNNAANASTRVPGSFDPVGTVSLGTIAAASTTAPQTLTFSSEALRAFVAANTNTHLTLVLVRQSLSTAFPTFFASREAANLALRPALLVVVPDNALPATATASASASGAGPALAVDGDFSTRWSAPNDTGSGTTRWLRLDLGSAQMVNRFTFTPHHHGRTHRLEHSLNGTTWTPLATGFRSGAVAGVNFAQSSVTRHFPAVSTRYLRLSTLSGVSGSAFSVWEASAQLDPAATPVLDRLVAARAAVAALPAAATADQLRRVVLEVALERAQAALDARDYPLAGRLLDDVELGRLADAATLAAPTASPVGLAVLRPLHVTANTPATNPYLARMVAGLDLALATADARVWEKSTADLNELADFNLARSTGVEMDTLLWLFAHPESPRRHHPEVLRRLLRRSYAFLDAIAVHADSTPTGQLASFFDDFAMGPASQVFREYLTLYPGLLLPAQKTLWTDAMTVAGDRIYDTHRNRVASWVNTDVAISCQLHNFAVLRPFDDPRRAGMLAKGQYFFDEIFAADRMFADGAVGYIGTQNEAGGYQATVSEYATRYFEMTGDPTAGELLRRMEGYGPINGPIHSWWTSPSWKLMWNTNSVSDHAGESVAGRNPYVRGELDAFMNLPATATNWPGVQRSAVWYQPGTPALARPDYTVFDRNIQGPRAWYGRWNYAATLRRIHPSESGHDTLMGAQVADASPFRINAALMGVYPRIRVSATPGPDTDGTFAENRHAWLTSGATGSVVVRRDFSTLAARRRLHVFGSSVKGAEVPWTARQLWLGLPDRVVGLVTLAPDEDTSVFEVQGALRLGHGGTARSPRKTLAADGPDAWTYGDLSIRLHGHDYTALTTDVYAFRLPDAPITEITLRDQLDGSTNTSPVPYAAGTRRHFIAEIRPRAVTSAITVAEVSAPCGLLAFEVDHPASGRRYRVVYNPGAATVVHTPDLAWPRPIRVHLGVAETADLPAWQPAPLAHRPDWLPEPTGPLPSTYWTNQTSVTLPPDAHVVFELFPQITEAAAPTAMERWRVLHFGTPIGAADAANLADPDGDGIPNLLEYAAGTSPLLPSAPVTWASFEGDRLSFGYQRIADPALVYTVQGTHDLVTGPWLTVQAPGNPSTGADNVAGPVVIVDSVPLSDSQRRFLRLLVAY